jgi:hypothetical protein
MPISVGSVTSTIEAGKDMLSMIGASNLGQMGKDVMGSRKAQGAVLGGLFLAGVGKEVVKPSIKAAMDVAFDDPDADQKVLGTDLTPSMLIGANIQGPIGGLARGRNAYRFGVGGTDPYTAQKNVGRGGAIIGAVGGGLLRIRKIWRKT